MDAAEKIESALAVTVPAAYREFLSGATSLPDIDDTSLIRDADAIIAATLDYRAGFAGLPAWPSTLLYLGDEADACPYALDVRTGEVLRLDKGNASRPPISRFASFADFTAYFTDADREDDTHDSPGMLERALRRPVLTGLLLWFIGLPIVVGTIKFVLGSLR